MPLLCVALAACDAELSGPSAAPAEPGSDLPVPRGLTGRLTATQHANIVRDVLGLDLSELDLRGARGIPEEQPSTGLFRNGADGQAAADDYPLAFGTLAAGVAEGVDIVSLVSALARCSGAELACARSFVAELGKRLFRRPLSEREREAFMALHASVLAEGLSMERAHRSVLEAMLQAPAFVFRLERELSGPSGQKRYLDGFELASRLAFFLWQSAPDGELLALAEAKALDGSPSALPVLRQQVRRLLADPRARRLTREFTRDFASSERAAFVGVTPALRSALLDSMVASVDQHLWQERGRISELFTTTRMSLDPSVASLIGLSPVDEGQRIYDVSGLPERVGWLTHPAFVAGIGDADVGKIVHRGITLMVKLMCRQPAQLPDALAAAAADFNLMFVDLTERQRSDQRRAMARPVAEGGSGVVACWGCHSQFEPLAYGFDRFDAAGRYVGTADARGRALPIEGWMTDDLSLEESARPRYANVSELMTLMAGSETIQACMAEHFIAFATGRASSSIEKSFSHPVNAAVEGSGGTLEAMVDAVTTSDLFRAQASSGPAPTAKDAP